MKLKHLFENKMNAEQAYKLAIQKGTPVPEYEDIIAKDSRYAYLYATNIIKGRFPAGEPVIAKHSRYAYLYAIDIIKGRFPAGEPAITKDSGNAYLYARDIIKGRWLEAEPTIAKNSQYAYWYARDIIKGRWPAGEPAITKDSLYAYRYKLFLYKNDINFDDLEKQPSEKGPLVVDEHIISNIPNHVKDSQLIKLMKISFPEVEDDEIVDFLYSKQQSSKGNLPVVTWKEYMDKNEQKYKPSGNDFS